MLTAAVLALTIGAAAPSGAEQKVQPPAPETVVDASQNVVSPGELAERAGRAQFILVGESHTNGCDHRVQARVLETLAEYGLDPILGLEMVAVDQQPVLDIFNERRIPVARLDEALEWPATWGFPFRLYRPLFEVAVAWDLPVVALNAPRQAAAAAADRGLDTARAKPRGTLPSEVVPPLPDQLGELREDYDAHEGLLEEGRRGGPWEDPFDRFLFAQSIWDSQMAEQALRWSSRLERPVVIAAGVGHVEHGWGIAHRLRTFAPSASALIVVPWRGDAPPDPEAGDLFFYCPAAR